MSAGSSKQNQKQQATGWEENGSSALPYDYQYLGVSSGSSIGAPSVCSGPSDHIWYVLGDEGKHSLSSVPELHARTEKRILNALWPNGAYINQEQMKMSRGESILTFACSQCPRMMRLGVQRPKPELVYIPQIRVETMEEDRIQGMYERLVRALKEVEASPTSSPQITKEMYPELCKSKDKYFVAPINMLQSVGFERIDGVYRVVNYNPTHARDMRIALEREIVLLKECGGDVEKAGSWMPWGETALLSKISSYADNVGMEIQRLRNSNAPLHPDQELLNYTKKIWAWCAAYWYYEFYSIIRSENRCLAYQLLNGATKLMCEVADRLWEKELPKAHEGLVVKGWDLLQSCTIPPAIAKNPGLYPIEPNASALQDIPRLSEIFSPKAAHLWNRSPADHAVLIDVSPRCCFSALTFVLAHTPAITTHILSVDVAQHLQGEHQDGARKVAADFLHRLQALLALALYGESRYVFSTYAREAFLELHNTEEMDGCGGVAGLLSGLLDSLGRGTFNWETESLLTSATALTIVHVEGSDPSHHVSEEKVMCLPAPPLHVETSFSPRPSVSEIPADKEEGGGGVAAFIEDEASKGRRVCEPLATLAERILQGMSCSPSRFACIAHLPSVLVVELQRPRWTEVFSKPQLDVTKVDIPVSLSLAPLLATNSIATAGGTDWVAYRARLVQMQRDLAKLQAANQARPTAAVEKVEAMLLELAGVVDANVDGGSSLLDRLQSAFETLRQPVQNLEESMPSSLENLTKEIAGLKDRLLEQFCVSATSPPETVYDLHASVVWDGAKYLSYVKASDQWLRYSSNTSDELPSVKVVDTAKVLADSRGGPLSAATCLVYLRREGNTKMPQLSALPPSVRDSVLTADEWLKARTFPESPLQDGAPLASTTPTTSAGDPPASGGVRLSGAE
eukprot:Sspe_Gene.44479::Locus_21816_Transcript_1_1_Confidence_1.000_Length_2822::g.44479::m.44479